MNENLLDLRDNRTARRGLLIGLGILVLVVVFLFLPITLSRSIDVACKVLPAREWLLTKNQEGAVLALLSDHLNGTVKNYTVVSIVRGDAFQFALQSRTTGDTVAQGDTIATLGSHQLARELYRLTGELTVANRTLAMVKAGEKAPIVEEAEKGLSLARERSQIQTALFIRQDSLYKKNLISIEAYELARSAERLARIDVAVAQAHLQTVATGAKPEQIRMIESQIASFEKEIHGLSDQLQASTLVSPFTGVLLASGGPDTLCTVEDTAKVCLIPIPVEYIARVRQGQSVTLRVARSSEPCTGTVARVDPRVRIVAGRQVLMVTAALGCRAASLPFQVVVAGSVETDRVSPLQYFYFWIADFLSEVMRGTTGI